MVQRPRLPWSMHAAGASQQDAAFIPLRDHPDLKARGVQMARTLVWETNQMKDPEIVFLDVREPAGVRLADIGRRNPTRSNARAFRSRRLSAPCLQPPASSLQPRGRGLGWMWPGCAPECRETVHASWVKTSCWGKSLRAQRRLSATCRQRECSRAQGWCSLLPDCAIAAMVAILVLSL